MVRFGRGLLALLVAVGGLPALVGLPTASAASNYAVQLNGSSQYAEPAPLRSAPPKSRLKQLPVGHSDERLALKLVEGSNAKVARGAFSPNSNADMTALNEVLARYGARVEPLFRRPATVLNAERARIEASSGRVQSSKSLWFRVRLAEGTNAVAAVNDLNGLAVVEAASAEPLPPPSPVTPDFEPDQAYRNPAPDGVDVDHAATVAGGHGENVTIIDIEYAWNDQHEDLAAAAGGLIPSGNVCDPFPQDLANHGTAVLGQLVATDNGLGVTGITPAASIAMVNAANWDFEAEWCGYDLANAIDTAHANMAPGDVMLIEQQVWGPDPVCLNQGGSQNGLVAVEWELAYYDAIVSATSDGIIVIEAAGNGSCDYDSGAYGTTFPGNRPDSGAIIVGAGAAGGGLPVRSRLGFSGHGGRVDLQGSGEQVTTTGYGDLYGGGSIHSWYTGGFGGTSSASPIVAGAAAVLSSIAQENGRLLSSQQIRSILKATGTPQDTSLLSGNIGPQPDLLAAIATAAATVPGVPTIIKNATAGNSEATVSWTAPASDGGSPITGYVVTPYVGYFPFPPITFNSTATTQVITGRVGNGLTYRFRVQAINAVGTSGYSTASNPVYPSTTVAPGLGAPTIIQNATAGGDWSATVSWTAPAADGGSPVTGYLVTPYVGYFALQPYLFHSTATTQTLTDVYPQGASFRFRVQAVNANGTGPFSKASNPVIPTA